MRLTPWINSKPAANSSGAGYQTRLVALVLLLMLFVTMTTQADTPEEQTETAPDTPPDAAASSTETCAVDAQTGETVCANNAPAEHSSIICQDNDEEPCAELVHSAGCISAFEYMRENCPYSCGLCHNNDFEDDPVHDLFHEVPQVIQGDQAPATYDRLRQVQTYMYESVYLNKSLEGVMEGCKNRHEHCTFWASLGECENNPGYMQMNCAPACYACHKLSFEWRCPFDRTNLTNTWQPGDLDNMFQRVLREYATLEPIVYSAPVPNLHPAQTHLGPWVVVLDNFLNENECVRLQELGAAHGYEQSLDVGGRKFDGTYDATQSPGRTSTNAWCVDECYADPISQQVEEKILNLTGIPTENYEYLQLLRYEEGQFYEQHHDFIAHHVDRAQGVRILTIFLYLNDVEEGGGTDFPKLNLTVMPKQGRVVIWPSVLNSDPDQKDGRTDHQALPVIKGVKYGANAWVHARDFKTPWSTSCH